MAPSFGRSISFPLSPARSSSSRTKTAARHVRSVSLPSSRAHPLLAHLHNTTRAWASAAEPTCATPSSGLAHLDALHAALAELLLLPEAQAALQHGSATADCLLDAFLALADAHGAFQEALLDLRRHAADARAALRRRDAARLASAARAQRHADKDLARLASSVRAAATKFHFPQLLAGSAASVAEVEVSGVLAEAVAAIASASAAVFSAVESVSSAATAAVVASSSSNKKPAAATIISLVTRTTSKAASACSDEDKETAALDKLEDLDECIASMETRSDKVFRSILQTRVALLNIRTQTC